MGEYTYTKHPAVSYSLRGHAPGYGRWWAIVTIREWDGGGSLDVQSDSGNYSYLWSSIGSESLRKFLCGLQFDYFMGKTRGKHYEEFDAEATQKAILEDIIRSRRNGNIYSKVAKRLWDDVLSMDVSYPESNFLEALFYEEELVVEIYDHSRCDIPWMKKPTMECLNFWEHIWPCACDMWRKELAEEQAPGVNAQ